MFLKINGDLNRYYLQTVCMLFLGSVFFDALPLKHLPGGVIYGICNGAFLLYDYGFSKIIGFYCQRIDRVLRKA